jgi:hypothetical protein
MKQQQGRQQEWGGYSNCRSRFGNETNEQLNVGCSSSTKCDMRSDKQWLECVAALELLSVVDVLIAARDDRVPVSGPIPRHQQALGWVTQQQHPGLNPSVIAAAAGSWEEQQDRLNVEQMGYLLGQEQQGLGQQQKIVWGREYGSGEGSVGVETSAAASGGGSWGCRRSELELWGLGLGQNPQGAVGFSSGSAWHVQLGFRGAEGTCLGAVVEGLVEEERCGVYGGEPRGQHSATDLDVAKEVGETLLLSCRNKLLGSTGAQENQGEGETEGNALSCLKQQQQKEEFAERQQQLARNHGTEAVAVAAAPRDHHTRAVAAALWGPGLKWMALMSEVLLLSGPMGVVQGRAAATDRLAALRRVCELEGKRQQQVGRMAGRVRRLPAFEHYLQHRRLTALVGARGGALVEMLGRGGLQTASVGAT